MDLSVQFIADNRPRLLEMLSGRQAILRDFTRAAAYGYSTGAYFFGLPGTGKTRTVRGVLEEELREPFCFQAGCLTPLGLFELIRDHPDELLVLDDVAAVFRSDVALQVLLSALDHPRPDDRSRTRIVRYRRQGLEETAAFRGAIVCISNRELHDGDLLGAFKSRVHTLNYDPTDAQLGALMLDIAGRGPCGLPPEEAEEVARHVIDETLRRGCRFDLRAFVDKAIPDYLQWKDGETESDWKDLVSASIEQYPVAAGHVEAAGTREARLEADRQIVREIVRDHPKGAARVAEWQRRTGNSERAYYRRHAEIQ